MSQQAVGMMAPTWLDGVIEKATDKGDATAIAQAIATSPQFLDAIKDGLANPPKPGIMGPSAAQVIRQAVIKAVSA